MTARVVLGLGGCIDYEVTVSGAALERLVVEYGIRAADVGDLSVIDTERDLVISILDFMRRGRGGERFATSPAVLERFAARLGATMTLGGTPVRAGFIMSRLGVPSTLHLVSLNDHFRRGLPAACDYICSSDSDSLYPHVIVQYDQHVEVRAGDVQLRTPFPNRLIYVHDPVFEELRLSDDLGTRLRDAQVFLISSFNGMRDAAKLDQRLEQLRHHMHQLPESATVYYEDAGFHRPIFSQRVRDALLQRINLYGLNEDELQAYLGRPVDLLSAADVALALEQLRALIPGPILVLHTKFWALAYGLTAEMYADALDQGIVAASTRYSNGDEYPDDALTQTRRTPRRADAEAFAAELSGLLSDRVCCRPGFDLDVSEPTTIGLGDTFVGGFLTTLCRTAPSRT